MSKLKPCPFCGGKPQLVILDIDREYFVECLKCKVEQGHCYKSAKNAIIAWNRRVSANERGFTQVYPVRARAVLHME